MPGVHLAARAGGEPAAAIAKSAEQVFTIATNGFDCESFRDVTFAMFHITPRLTSSLVHAVREVPVAIARKRAGR
jgi:hypothetical protein